MGGVASAPERVVGPSGRHTNLRGFAHPIDLRSGALPLHGEFAIKQSPLQFPSVADLSANYSSPESS
jgi:hypothetical protein